MRILAEDIRPTADLKNKSNQLLRHLQKTRRPILLTQNGKPTAVLVDVKEFAKKLASRELAFLLKKAEKEIAEGKGRDIDEFFEEFAKTHKLESKSHR
jgi:prevent-host-death family protein